MKLIRGSEINDFLRCRLKWSYAWQENLKPRRPDGKLFIGTLIHKWLEVYHANTPDPRCEQLANDAMIDLFNETDTSLMEQVELDDLIHMAKEVTRNYAEQWWHQDKKMQVIATELTFAIPLDDEIGYTGTIDLIWKDEDGHLWFSDHKSVSSIDQYVDNAVMDRQISRYWWALQQLARGNGCILQKYTSDIDGQLKEQWIPVGTHILKGKLGHGFTEPSGFIYNLLLKDCPKPPEPLKKGGLSKAKNQRTTYKVYRDALIKIQANDPKRKPEPMVILSEGYMIPEEYKEILDHLKAQETEQGNRFFRRVEVFRNQAEIDAAMQEFEKTVDDAYPFRMFERRPQENIYRNITHDCSWCIYKDLCLAEMDGSNAHFIRENLYTQREDV